LKVHDVLHVSDIKVDQNIEIVSPPETVVAVVSVVREEEVPVVEEEAPTEPEVEAKGKKEDEAKLRWFEFERGQSWHGVR